MGLFGRDERPAPSTPTPAPTPARPVPSNQANAEVTTIANQCTLTGALTGTADIVIKGELDGEVDGAGSLTISQSGKVKAKLRARNVVVAGTVRGDVIADEKIELKPTAHLQGNITAPRILIQEGATFEGQVFMKKPSGTSAAQQPAKPADRPKEPDKPVTGPDSKGPKGGEAKDNSERNPNKK